MREQKKKGCETVGGEFVGICALPLPIIGSNEIFYNNNVR